MGIGGIGMSAIAHVMLAMGFTVSGSDISKSETVYRLEKAGVKIFIGHKAENIGDVDAVVLSTAIPADNPEIVVANERGIPIYHRADLLGYLMNSHMGMAIAGAHGKTTTASMVAVMLDHAGQNPTVMIGGDLTYFNGNAKLGKSDYVVAEADESDGSFVKLRPNVAVVTNIENDHMDYYHSMDKMLGVFSEFLCNLPQDKGLAILCYDNELVRKLAEDVTCGIVSYGIESEADYQPLNVRINGASIIYDVLYRGESLGSVTLNVPGRHNVANSLAAVAIGRHIGLEFEQIVAGLAAFQGVKRRFQTKGRVNGVWIVDDYAHHPTEIRATLEAARSMNPKRIICIFQPHRYSRTKLLLNEFAQAFGEADHLVLTDIYAASEQPIEGIDGETLQTAVEEYTGNHTTYIADKQKIARYLTSIAEDGDLIITMGAGDIYRAGEELIELFTQA